MKTLNVNEWELSGESTFGNSYFHKENPSLMLKVLNPGMPVEELDKELEMATRVYNLGIRTPKPGEAVLFDGRRGILFERIVGKRSFARAVGDEPDNLEYLAGEYAAMVKTLHSTQCDTSAFPSIKEIYREQVLANPDRDGALKEKAVRFLDFVPDETTCIHGDMHFGNVIISGGGSYFIDLGNFSYGYPLFDFAMMDLLIAFGKIAEPKFTEIYHCSVADAERFWNLAVRGYFGPGTDAAAKRREFMPFMAIRQLTIETVTGMSVFPASITDPLFESLEK